MKLHNNDDQNEGGKKSVETIPEQLVENLDWVLCCAFVFGAYGTRYLCGCVPCVCRMVQPFFLALVRPTTRLFLRTAMVLCFHSELHRQALLLPPN
jgi:hypothetical protein